MLRSQRLFHSLATHFASGGAVTGVTRRHLKLSQTRSPHREEGGMLDQQKTHSPIEAIRQWYRGLTRSQPGLADCGPEGLERMAHDIGVSSTELCRLASHGPESLPIFCSTGWKCLTLTGTRSGASNVLLSRICSGFAPCVTVRSAAPGISRTIPAIRSGRIIARTPRR